MAVRGPPGPFVAVRGRPCRRRPYVHWRPTSHTVYVLTERTSSGRPWLACPAVLSRGFSLTFPLTFGRFPRLSTVISRGLWSTRLYVSWQGRTWRLWGSGHLMGQPCNYWPQLMAGAKIHGQRSLYCISFIR